MGNLYSNEFKQKDKNEENIRGKRNNIKVNKDTGQIYLPVSDLMCNFVFRCSLRHPHILQFEGLDPENNEMMIFEGPRVSLEQLLNSRGNNYFPENNLVMFLNGISSALAYLNKNGIGHGFIENSNIFFDYDSGAFKIFDHELIGGKNHGLRNFIENGNQKFTFIAPEFIQLLNQSQNQYLDYKMIPTFKSDIFSLGMTFIEIATLTSSKNCYSTNPLGLNVEKIGRRLEIIRHLYGNKLYKICMCMLDLDANSRFNAESLFSILQNYEFAENLQIPSCFQNNDTSIPIPIPNQTIQQQQFAYTNLDFDRTQMQSEPRIELNSHHDFIQNSTNEVKSPISKPHSINGNFDNNFTSPCRYQFENTENIYNEIERINKYSQPFSNIYPIERQESYYYPPPNLIESPCNNFQSKNILETTHNQFKILSPKGKYASPMPLNLQKPEFHFESNKVQDFNLNANYQEQFAYENKENQWKLNEIISPNSKIINSTLEERLDDILSRTRAITSKLNM